MKSMFFLTTITARDNDKHEQTQTNSLSRTHSLGVPV